MSRIKARQGSRAHTKLYRKAMEINYPLYIPLVNLLRTAVTTGQIYLNPANRDVFNARAPTNVKKNIVFTGKYKTCSI